MALGFVNPSRAARLAAVVLVAGFGLAGCESLSDLIGGKARDADKPVEYVDRPVDQIYADAWKKIAQDDFVGAAKQFDEVERQHPYSIWARRAMLMSAYCYYKANHYPDAISTADSYIQLHPGSREVAYAFYLKAVSLYEQIVDVGRDQSNTEDALTALQDVVQRFPDTEYARDATLKIDLTLDHLAGKEMAVGRYYLRQQDYIGAINRFKVVVEQYQKTSQIAEAPGAADRGLLRARHLQRGAERRRRAGRQLSRQPLVPGCLQAPDRTRHAAAGGRSLLVEQDFRADSLKGRRCSRRSPCGTSY
ncbi:MAG: outer membrane protein assembly factor BamD [Rhizomicrobium sp.]